MKKLSYIFLVITFCLLTQNCKKIINNKPEEFIYHNQVRIDSEHFAVAIYSKTLSDSTILYTDTIVGKLSDGEDFKTEWFDDYVKCIVPTYIPEKTLRTPTNLKVILKHK